MYENHNGKQAAVEGISCQSIFERRPRKSIFKRRALLRCTTSGDSTCVTGNYTGILPVYYRYEPVLIQKKYFFSTEKREIHENEEYNLQ